MNVKCNCPRDVQAIIFRNRRRETVMNNMNVKRHDLTLLEG